MITTSYTMTIIATTDDEYVALSERIDYFNSIALQEMKRFTKDPANKTITVDIVTEVNL